ncbi:hypothetical protein H3N35_16130 [Thalassomonas haliotis]|uniref:Solute-binding protein family 3/N-terminal domain-containing protein n=1 Tax=Thalassomonas haliotis TaxID=485448 RepID=A0ABY7V855_9GAMM|nr:hypothetical protein H3N35_16130 [Thalassomonas haliotis]
MSALHWNEARGRHFHFSQAYFYNESYTFVLRDKVFPYQNLTDLKGLTGIYLGGSSFGEDFDGFIREKKLQQRQWHTTIVALPTPLVALTVHFAVSKKSPCAALLPGINREIKRAQADGTLTKLIEKHRQKSGKKGR